jgi:hypothetical protein
MFSCIRCIFKLILSLVIIAALILAAIFIGSAVQKGKAKKAADITPKYTDGHVCAFTKYANGSATFTSYNSVSAVFSSNATASPTAAPALNTTAAPSAAPTTTIGQCGDCGKCSNFKDYEAFVKLVGEDFYENLGSCSVRAAAGSKYVDSCLQKNVGFSPGCSSTYREFLTLLRLDDCNPHFAVFIHLS